MGASISGSAPLSVADRFDLVIGRVSRVVAFAGTVMLGLLGLLICVDVVGRAFGTPLTGVVEIVKMTVVIITFLMLPYTMHRGSHIRSTLIISRLPQRVSVGLTAFANTVGLVAFGVIAWASWEPSVVAWTSGAFEGEGALRVPVWPARWAVTLASFLMVIECGNAAYRALRERELR